MIVFLIMRMVYLRLRVNSTMTSTVGKIYQLLSSEK